MPLKILTKFLRQEGTAPPEESKLMQFKYYVRRSDKKNLFDLINQDSMTLAELKQTHWQNDNQPVIYFCVCN